MSKCTKLSRFSQDSLYRLVQIQHFDMKCFITSGLLETIILTDIARLGVEEVTCHFSLDLVQSQRLPLVMADGQGGVTAQSDDLLGDVVHQTHHTADCEAEEKPNFPVEIGLRQVGVDPGDLRRNYMINIYN